MKRLVILFSLLLLTSALGLLKAQQQNSFEVPQVIPPSPDAAALGKYGNIPVGLNTGIPDISIPLYTIKTSKLEVPISISYHAVGFKVSEIASWIGLGWVLNAGGVITRSVVGRPDEGGFWEKSIKNASQITSNDYDYLKSLADGSSDGESDYYFYNFIGHSGKFVYDQNKNVYETPLLIPQEPIKVVYTSGHYEVTNEIGVQYKFTDYENSNFTGANHLASSFKSSYYLSDIISADGMDSIRFSYVTDTSCSVTDKCFTETIGQICTSSGLPNNNYYIPNDVNYFRMIYSTRLKEINFTNGKVEFIKDYTRNDAPETRLDTIIISEKNSNGTFKVAKKIAFGEGYFDTPGGSGQDWHRLKLTGITEQDAQGITIKKYSFSYNEDEMLPVRTSLAQDWWGFYNGRTTNLSLIETDTITFNGWQYPIGNGNREPDSASMQACILKKIVYPTGGYTEFEYGPNYYGTNSNIMAGGLRVNKIRDYEEPGKTPVTKVFKYGIDGSGRGKLLTPAEGLNNSKQVINFQYGVLSSNGAQSFCENQCNGQRMIITGRPVYDLTTLNGSPVGYPEVTVYDSSSTAPVGKKVAQFNIVEDEFMGVDQTYNNGEFQMNNGWRGGDDTCNVVYRGNTFDKIEETSNTYSVLSGNTSATGTKVGWKITREGCPFSYIQNIDDFYFFDYNTYSGIKKLTSTTKKQYSSTNQADIIETKTTFVYDSLSDLHQQLRKRTVINSQGDTSVTKYWYPDDYNRNTISNTLLAKNIIAIPIKEENYRSNKIIGGKITQYNDDGNPKEIDLYETIQPQPSPTHNKDSLVPHGYVKRADIIYNNYKNIQSMQKSDNIKTSYLWGYDNTLPIAEIKNSGIDSMHTNFSASNVVDVNITSNSIPDLPLSSSFEIFSNQSVTPFLSVFMLGSGGPPSPLLSPKLKKSDGTVVTTLSCSWGTNSVSPISISPGIYQWYYSATGISGTFLGYDLNITTSYTGQRTGYNIFYTSFEDNGVPNSSAKTGSKVWSGIYVFNLPGNNGDYKLTYWQKTGSNPWTLIEQTVSITNGSVQPISIGASGSIIDEVRICPKGTEMTTYTYEPLNGISSVTDQNQNITYYEYDNFGRLQIIRDNDRNILKKYSYHYKE